MSLGKRFISAYNDVDNRLRAKFGYSDRMSYSDVIRKSAERYSLVRRYEDELLSYGRLRNAIVHDSFGNELIAEPHEYVVETFEFIASALAKPPKAVSCDVKYNIATLSGEDALEKAIELMYKSGYSVIPVMENGRILGVISDKHVVIFLGAALEKGKDVETAFASLKLSMLVRESDEGTIYEVLPESVSLFDVLDSFERSRKLRAVLITSDGKRSGKLIRIFTPVDTVEISRILEDYNVKDKDEF